MVLQWGKAVSSHIQEKLPRPSALHTSRVDFPFVALRYENATPEWEWRRGRPRHCSCASRRISSPLAEGLILQLQSSFSTAQVTFLNCPDPQQLHYQRQRMNRLGRTFSNYDLYSVRPLNKSPNGLFPWLWFRYAAVLATPLYPFYPVKEVHPTLNSINPFSSINGFIFPISHYKFAHIT